MKEQTVSKIERKRRGFAKWRLGNPSKSFKDYFAEKVQRKVNAGRAHASLGRNLKNENFVKAPATVFPRNSSHSV
jgi:hypothetical protein